jgi:hypothetical protein
MSRLADLTRFYGLLGRMEDRAGGPRRLGQFSDYRDWPDRGVYFFFEEGETRSDTGPGRRVVRVGTHALAVGARSTLRQRLGQHRGTATGGGNHRGSIFRLLVGAALIAQGSAADCASWGVKGEARTAAADLGLTRERLAMAETPIEAAVSDHIGAMPLLWINVPDEPHPESLRGMIERNAIALLSNHGRPLLDPASDGWLGRHCPRPLVRSSGLWNQRHTDDAYDPRFLNVLEDLIT